MAIVVRAVEERDAAAWADLYAGYRSFYRLDPDPRVVARTWSWVSTGQHGLLGLVAVDEARGDDVPLALANLRWFARPSRGSLGLYLDDLFTSPGARGTGAATALLRHASALASAQGADVVRWITAADNATARRLYDEVATATNWVTYDMGPA